MPLPHSRWSRRNAPPDDGLQGDWRIAFRKFTERYYCELSITSYETVHAAQLAFQRDPISYRELA